MPQNKIDEAINSNEGAATIFTSLPPRTVRMVDHVDYGPSYQRACLQSWADAGFTICSLNSSEEIDALSIQNFPVTYITSSNPRPLIKEFLEASLTATTDVVGIVNADCFLLNFPEMIRSALQRAKTGLVTIERVNISPKTLLPTGQTCLGFDAFFFNKERSKHIEIDARLAVGQPWWDYWLPVEFALGGCPLFTLGSPIVWHLDHDQGWSQQLWLDTGRRLLNRLTQSDGAIKTLDFKNFLEPHQFDRDDIGGFGDWIFNWLRDRSEIVSIEAATSFSYLFSRFLNSIANFDGMHAATLSLADARRRLDEYTDYPDLRKQLPDLHNQLEDLREAHKSAERYAFHLLDRLTAAEKELEDLREAHKSAERHALHLLDSLTAAGLTDDASSSDAGSKHPANRLIRKIGQHVRRFL